MDKVEKFNTLCRNVFSTAQGKELLELMEDIFVDVKLFQDTDRKTVYLVAQRDLIMELKGHLSTDIKIFCSVISCGISSVAVSVDIFTIIIIQFC